MQLWHNPRCSKSREAKQLLDAAGAAYTERRYLDDPPTTAELDAVLAALDKDPWEIVRFGEPVARELDLKNRRRADRAGWLAVLSEDPELIERPILVTGDGRAAVGRPPEAIARLLGERC